MANPTGFFWNLRNHIVHATEGFRMLERKKHVKLHGFRRYGKKWDDICRNIVKACYSRGRFTVSTGHFNEIYCRDFGWCVEHLIRMGYKKEALSTAEYMLQVFKDYSRVSTTIDPNDQPFDFPVEGPDSLAYFVRSLQVIDRHCKTKLLEENRGFLQGQAEIFFKKFIDAKTGLVKNALHVSSIRDHGIRSSSCYDNCMTSMLASDLSAAGIESSLDNYKYPGLIKKYFWTGKGFRDDLGDNDYISADANIFPFWCGIFKNKTLLRKSLRSMSDAGLDDPFPTKFVPDGKRFRMIRESMFANRYELNTYWGHMAPMHIDLLAKSGQSNKSKARKSALVWKEIIEKYGTYPEVLERDKTPYTTAFYVCDEGMLWASMFYDVVKRHKLFK